MIRYEAFSSGSVGVEGMSSVLVARMRGSAEVEIGIFLVDTWCLGIKDAMFLEGRTEIELREIVKDRMPDGGVALHPACAKKLIEGALAYAEKLGFAPHRDFRKARRVLSGLEAKTCPETFTFGHEGKPCFAVGPNDSRERVERVLAVLRARCGDDGFGYIDMLAGEYEDAGAEFAESATEPDDEHRFERLIQSRNYLREALAGAAPPAPTYRQLGGMLAALCVGLPADIVDVVLDGLVQRAGFPLNDAAERDHFKQAANVCLVFQLGLFMQAVKEPPGQARVIDLSDAAEGDLPELASCLVEWCQGFLRVTELWPEVWRDALARPDLAPHWALLRAWARPEAKRSIEAGRDAGAAEVSLSGAVMALHRAFREKR
jgi:hypothetical protein